MNYEQVLVALYNTLGTLNISGFDNMDKILGMRNLIQQCMAELQNQKEAHDEP